MQLKLAEAGYRSYRITLKEVSSGRTIRTWTGLRAQTAQPGKVVIVKVPTSNLAGPAKDYIVILDGITSEGRHENEIDKYSFKIEKK